MNKKDKKEMLNLISRKLNDMRIDPPVHFFIGCDQAYDNALSSAWEELKQAILEA